MKNLYFFILIIFSVKIVSAQKFIVIDGKKSIYCKDSIHLKHTLTKKIRTADKAGYVLVEIDTFFYENVIFFYIKKNKKFFWENLVWKNSDLCKVRIKSKNAKKASFEVLNEDFEKIIMTCENNGYPFATVLVDTFFVEQNKLYLFFELHRNKKFFYGKIFFADTSLQMNFLPLYLNFREGDLYKEKNTKKIDETINASGIISIRRPSIINFHDTVADLYIFATPLKTNRLSALLGFENKNSKISITGNFDMLLRNFFKISDLISLNYKGRRNSTRILNLKTNFPYLFSQPLGINSALELYKQDTSFISLHTSISFNWMYSRYNKTGIGYLYKSGFSTNNQKDNFSADFITFGVDYSNLDNPEMPTKGLSVVFLTGYGTKKSKDSIVTQNLFLINFEHNLPLTKNFVLTTKSFFGYLSGENLFDNEKFRLGGFGILRGFDEDYFFATQYWTNTLKFKFVTKNSFELFVFSDFGRLYNGYKKTDVLSFGTGMRILLNSGMLTLILANGTESDKFDFYNTKIHLGFKAYF